MWLAAYDSRSTALGRYVSRQPITETWPNPDVRMYEKRYNLKPNRLRADSNRLAINACVDWSTPP